MSEKIKQYLNFRCLLYFFSLIAGWPCVFFLMGWLPHYTVNYIVLFILSVFFLVVKNEFRLPRPIGFLIVLQIFVWGVYSILHGCDTSYFTRIFILCLTYAFLEFQLSGERLGFVKVYNFWLVFQVIAGSIGMILVLLGILRPIFEFRELDFRLGYFFGTFTSNVYFDGLIRNAGFYDEPGALAFWGIYALIINKLFIENKKIERLLILGLFSTLSLAYFIQIVMYVFFFYRKNIQKMWSSIIAFFLLLILLSSFNHRMHEAIFGRMEYNKSTGTFVGDNRSMLMGTCWDIFKTSPIIGQGARHMIEISKERNVFVGANPLLVLASDGIIGQFIVLSPFFFLFILRRNNKKYGGAFWILMVGLLQRPYDCTQLLYPLMSFTIVLQAYLQKNEVKYGTQEEKVVA